MDLLKRCYEHTGVASNTIYHSFVQSWSAYSAFNGEKIAAETSTIVVTMNYHLGALGFLAVDEINGNFGFLVSWFSYMQKY